MTTAETRAGALPELADVPARDLRVAVLGVGLMGADHVSRIYSRISGARVVAVSDAFAEKAEQVAGEVAMSPLRDGEGHVRRTGVEVVLDDREHVQAQLVHGLQE